MILQPNSITQSSFDVPSVNSALTLNKAVSAGAAMFSLYLAINEARGDESIAWSDAETSEKDSHFPVGLDHYRRSPLSCTEGHVDRYLAWQAGLTAACSNEHIRLWQAISPDPLSFRNDEKRLEPQVKQNCPYRTQLAWVTEQQAQVQEPDATLLADTIPASLNMTV